MSLHKMTRKIFLLYQKILHNETSEDESRKPAEASEVLIKSAYSELDQYNWRKDQLLAKVQEKKGIWDKKGIEDYRY